MKIRYIFKRGNLQGLWRNALILIENEKKKNKYNYFFLYKKISNKNRRTYQFKKKIIEANAWNDI